MREKERKGEREKGKWEKGKGKGVELMQISRTANIGADRALKLV